MKLSSAPKVEQYYNSLVSNFFSAFDDQGCKYIILHGFCNLANLNGDDLDVLIDKDQSAHDVDKAVRLGAERAKLILIRKNRLFYTFHCNDPTGKPAFFSLDLSSTASLPGFNYCDEAELLSGRRKFGTLWVPAAEQGFFCYLMRCLLKAHFDIRKKDELTRLYNEASEIDLQRVMEKKLPLNIANVFVHAIETNRWEEAENSLKKFSAELQTRYRKHGVKEILKTIYSDWTNRLGRILKPGGLSVVMLGQDGAGKSTTIDAIEHSKNLPFGQTIVWGFAPPMHRLFKRGPVKTDTPHALPPRSFLMSMAKAIYWMIHAILGHFTLRLAKSKNTLVLYDRHFTDVLVDPIRYRFGGPNWMLDLIFRLTPRPDLILLLDAPPDILHERKPELELSERHRQRKKYLELVARLPNSVIVDATKSQAQVIETVQTKIVDRLIANQR